MYRINRMGKDGVDLIQLILCILYIHIKHSDCGSGYAGLGEHMLTLSSFTFFKWKNPIISCTAASLFLIVSTSRGWGAADIHVSPTGVDANHGTASSPVATLARAQSLARTASAKGEAVMVTVHGGIYYLPETLVFDARDSGTAKAPVLYQAAPGEKAVISGGRKLDLKWEVYKDHIYKAAVPEGLQTEELFVNGERQILARYPNFDPKAKYFDGFASDAAGKARAARWADPAGGYLHAMHPALWGDFTWRITGKDNKGEITKEGGWQNNRGGSVHREIRFVENIFEELDAPGEWYLDSKTHTIYYWPPASVDLTKSIVEVTCLRSLVEFRGTEQKPVRFVTLRGFTFRNAARTMMDTKEPLLRTDWAIYRGGAIYFEGTEDCALEDSLLDQLGGNAVFVNHYNRRVTVRGCEIARAGASGICLVGDAGAARNALSNYSQSNNAASIDRTPGPANNTYPAQCLVENCLIYLTGRVEKQTAGIEIDLAQDITVRHCSIYDMPRAGINIGDGCWGGHVIEFCDVFDTVKETGDHGSFNSWGRDRYWNLTGATAEELPELALLDVVKPITLRNNRWRCDHGWDVDLDDGSSHYEIYNNLFLSGGLKLREGFHRRVSNNVAVNNSLHPHVWYDDSRDEVTRNIWMGAYRPAGAMTKGKWGKEVDRNLFTTSNADRTRFSGHGCDANSVVGDPMFVDPAKGDFRVRDGSPALALGFANFPMDQFGVVSPALKAKARTPQIPALETRAATPEKPAAPKVVWLGATVKDLEGEEYSAFGVAKGDRGVAILDVPAGSAAAAAGLRKSDLLQSLNGEKIAGQADLFAVLSRVGDKPLVADIVRDQRPQKLNLGSLTHPQFVNKIGIGEAIVTDWNGYDKLSFSVNGRAAILVKPKSPAPGRPWIWRTEFFGAFPSVDLALLERGWHVAYLNVSALFGAPVALKAMDGFPSYLAEHYQLTTKPVLEGFSRGGLYAFNWAANNPQKVASLYVDAPVCDFKSWPGGKGSGRGSPKDWQECLKAYGLTEEAALAYKLNPVDNLAAIAAARIPIIAVAGDADQDVPVSENISIVETRYRALGGEIKVIIKHGCGHHPHSLTDPTPVVEFLSNNLATKQ